MGEQTLRGKLSGVRCNGASNHSDVEREINDFYATPPVATKKLIEHLKEKYPKLIEHVIWEPACGKGHISEEFRKAGYTVISTDLIERGYGSCGEEYDFLKMEKNIHTDGNCSIVTNPPYKYAQEFVEKSMELLEDGQLCCMLLKLTFLEGKKRYQMFKKYPPNEVLVFSERINCNHGGNFTEKDQGIGGAVAYAWYIWIKGYKPNNPKLSWISLSE